eukprot:gene14446-20455_t
MVPTALADAQPSLSTLLDSDPSATVALALAGPSAYIMHGDRLDAADLADLSNSACKHLASGRFAHWEVSAVAWGLACMGAEATLMLVDELRRQLEEGSQKGMPLQDLTVL